MGTVTDGASLQRCTLERNEAILKRSIMKYCRMVMVMAVLVSARVTTSLAADVEGPAPAMTNRINVLFLMDDQHRGDWINAAGAKWIITPNLDRLAREGVLFRRGYSSTPSCTPAREALLTGMSPWGHGNLGFGRIPEKLAVEKPRLFTEAGYRTHAVGKNHFTPQRNTHGYQTVALGEPKHANGAKGAPFDDFEQWFAAQMKGVNPYQDYRSGNDQRGGIHYAYDERFHETRWTADQAIDFLEKHPKNAPWFLKVSWVRPHAPYSAPKRWYDRYEGVAIPQAQIGDWARKSYGDKTGSFQKDADLTRGVVSDEEIRESRRSYAAAISFVDEQMGRVLDALEKRGELENTLILFTADHGDIMGDNLLYRKTYPVEGSVSVPMIVRWPEALGLNAKRGQVRQELVELRDVLPTFMDGAGLAIPTAVEGKSMLDVLRGKSWRDTLDLEHASCYEPKDGWVALVGQRYKYIYYTITGEQQLFDLANDPHELYDLAPDPASASVVKEWRKKMIQHLSARGEDWVSDNDLVIQPKAVIRRANPPFATASHE
jgi:arylsulfatase A-like enzyme